MSTFLLDKDLNGAFEAGAKGNREVRTLARARTLAVLERLDPAHKRLVMEFLVKPAWSKTRPERSPS